MKTYAYTWDPVRELIRQLNTSAHDDGSAATPATEFLPVNLDVSEDTAVLTAELPGVSPTNVNVSLHEDLLTITAQRDRDPGAAASADSSPAPQRWSRSIPLPFPLAADAISATLQHGVLTVTGPRSPADRPRRIAVSAA